MKKLMMVAITMIALGGSVIGLDNKNENNSINKSEKIETNYVAESLTNEADIYSKSDSDSVAYLPMKAYRMQYKGIEYSILSDGYEKIIITKELLKNGQNYQVLYGLETDTVYGINEDEFKFTYEDQFKINENNIKNKGVDKFLREYVTFL